MTEAESLAARIEREVRRIAEQDVVVEETDTGVVLSGIVQSDRDRQAVLDVARTLAGEREVDDDLELLQEIAPGAEAPDQDRFGGVAEGMLNPNDPAVNMDGELEPDFADQPLISDPVLAAGGSSDTDTDDLMQEGETYTPPMDPVVSTDNQGAPVVLNGFGVDSMDSMEVDRSASDGQLGDEAIEDAVRRKLAEDSATTALLINVHVVGGVVRLTGQVGGMEDAESAEDVASRVPGVVEVREELEVVTV